MRGYDYDYGYEHRCTFLNGSTSGNIIGDDVMGVHGEIVIGSRGSRLAMVQAELVKRQLEMAWPSLSITIQKIKTTGDKVRNVALDKIGGKGLFTKEIERALLAGAIDLAVHSMKDLPTALPGGLAIGAVTAREDPHDGLVATGAADLGSLPAGARLATGSLRRKAQVLNVRPDLEIRDLRGNLDTRLRKLDRREFDAMIVACAGMRRMGKDDRITEVLPYSVMLPAVGQGALAVEIRKDDQRACEVAAPINDAATEACVTAERAMLTRLRGGCHVPIGAVAEIDGGVLRIEGVVATLDGSEVLRAAADGSLDAAGEVGTRAAEQLLDMGADRILEEAGTG